MGLHLRRIVNRNFVILSPNVLVFKARQIEHPLAQTSERFRRQLAINNVILAFLHAFYDEWVAVHDRPLDFLIGWHIPERRLLETTIEIRSLIPSKSDRLLNCDPARLVAPLAVEDREVKLDLLFRAFDAHAHRVMECR